MKFWTIYKNKENNQDQESNRILSSQTHESDSLADEGGPNNEQKDEANTEQKEGPQNPSDDKQQQTGSSNEQIDSNLDETRGYASEAQANELNEQEQDGDNQENQSPNSAKSDDSSSAGHEQQSSNDANGQPSAQSSQQASTMSNGNSTTESNDQNPEQENSQSNSNGTQLEEVFDDLKQNDKVPSVVPKGEPNDDSNNQSNGDFSNQEQFENAEDQNGHEGESAEQSQQELASYESQLAKKNDLFKAENTSINPDNTKKDSSKELDGDNETSIPKEEASNSFEDIDSPMDDANTADNKKEKLMAVKEQLKKILSQVDRAENNDNKTVDEIKKELERTHLTGEKELPTESIEEKYDLSNANQELIDKLKQITPFQDRERGPGYAIDTNGHTDVPDSVIRTLVTRFLDQRFIKKETDLNVRSNSLEKTTGFHKWDVKAVVTHLQTHQITKVLTDKYGYEYDNGKNENVPLSFYFDLSDSMSSYTNLLATIAIELLKKKVKVLVGYNERVNYQIDSISKIISIEELANLLMQTGEYDVGSIYNPNAKMKKVNRNLDNYLLALKAEKCVVFADFDPLKEVVNLSQGCNVYWFCFESNFEKSDLQKYKGFLYPVQNITDIAKGLIKVSDYRFETLCYLVKETGRGRVKTL